jgi:hypothetical protein
MDDEKKSYLIRHARESGHPIILSLSSMTWIPAFAGMTDSGPLVTGVCYALPVLAMTLFENLFWIGVTPHLGQS